MSKVTVIGSGTIGTAVAGIASASGAQVQILARDPEKAAASAPSGSASGKVGDPLLGDIVVLAIPYAAVGEVLDIYRGQLSGKTVVDVTNPVDFSTFDSLVVPEGSSATQIIQEAVPEADVVKAFNTNFGATLTAGKVGTTPTTVLVAGDSDTAKQKVIEFVTAGGLHAIDAGSLKRAHELEAFAFLQMTLAAAEKISWAGGFAVIEQ